MTCRSIAVLALCASGFATPQSVDVDAKPVPVAPQMEDVKAPAPPAPVKAPVSAEERSARSEAPVALPAKSTAHAAGSGFLAGLERTAVLFDTPGDGRIWAAGDAYKASFGVEGATYVPFFGSRAPQNYPVRFVIRSIKAGASEIAFDAAAQPVRQGERIVFDRGIVDEVYDLSLGSIEQSFVFDSLPERGELVIELEAQSEMSRSQDAQGLVFSSAVGSVRYTNAVAIDAGGVRADAPTAWDEGGIEIRLAGGDVERAAFPLVVDPVLSTFSVDANATEDHSLPDVSFDATNNRWLATYERAFSASDHDIYSKLMNSIGGTVSFEFIDVTTTYWADAKVANNNIDNQFLCVAEVGSPTGGARIIRGRTRFALTGTMGSQFTISGTETGEKTDPDVGGDPHTVGPTYYCVVYKRTFTDDDTDVLARLVETNSTTFGSVIFLSNTSGTLDGNPAISKGDGAPPASDQDWNIVFTRSADLFDLDLYGARIHWDGSITSNPFAIETSSTNTSSPSVSTSIDAATRRYLVTYTAAPFLGDPDIHGKLMSSTIALDTTNLTALTGAPDDERQISSSCDSDGYQFVLVNAETFNGSTTDYDVYASTISIVGSHLAAAEGHVNLAFSAAAEDQPRVACPESSAGPDRPSFVVWHQATAADNGDIEASLYEMDPFTSFCNPGLEGVISCPCGNAPSFVNRGCNNSANTGGARLTATGSPAGDTVLLTATSMLPTALCIFAQGDGVSTAGLTFGDGVRCATGQLLRLGTKSASGGTAAYPTGTNPSIQDRAAALGAPIAAGSKRYYYTYYRDPIAFACAATFNTTNAVQVQW